MGSNTEGKLGIGSMDVRNCNVPTLVEGIRGVSKVACGGSHTLAMTFEGEAYSWGQSYYGALGVQSAANVLTPSKVPGLPKVSDISAGGKHSFFIAERRAYCCGDASQGQLGLQLSTGQDRVCHARELLKFSEVDQVACGKYHTLFIVNGEVWGTGANNYSQVNSNGYSTSSPVKIDLPARALQVSASNSSAAILETGHCFIWGMGYRNPTKLEDCFFKSVQVGGQFSVLVDTQG